MAKNYVLSAQVILFFSFIQGAIDETNLELFFQANLSNKKIVYVQNPGNAGDALIWYGTMCLFKKIGLKYTSAIDENEILSSDVVIYSGGGNLVPYYNDAAKFMKHYMHKVKRMIILPHTIQGHEELLRNLTPNVTLFCREYMSYEYCKKTVSYPDNVFFSRDMAFYADLSTYKNIPFKLSELYAFRTDDEKNSGRENVVIPANRDISSEKYIYGDSSWEYIMNVVNEFLSAIAQYDVVWTDRLHVGIAAFLLGKKVHLLDNAYGKVAAVY